jgi:phosphoribosylformimino-5-aminoimidazole carboxamide ribotide isomerase
VKGSLRRFDSTSPEIFPAIDVRGGRCVRLVRGARDAEIRYDDDPVAAARRWEEAGARCLHVIDLGAAFREPDSRGVMLEIARAAGIPVQCGGGLRDEDAVGELLDGGVARVILGTRALSDPPFLERMVARHGAARIVVSLDVDGERVKVAGWEEESPLGIDAAIEQVAAAGADRLLVTATDRDGTLSGPRIDLIRRVLETSAARVVAAGGVGRLEDVAEVLALARPPSGQGGRPGARSAGEPGGGRRGALEGVVVGRALYEGALRLEDALALATGYGDRDRGRPT